MTLSERVLEGGAQLAPRSLGGWIFSDEDDLQELRASCTLTRTRPTVLFVPPLTGSADATTYWGPLFGDGRLFRPWTYRLLGFDLLGSAIDRMHNARFPSAEHERPGAAIPLRRGELARAAVRLPAALTPWDMARALRDALDALGVAKVHLAVGGSLGGMVVQCLAALLGRRLARAVPIASPLYGTASMIGWNHLGREAILADDDFPGESDRSSGLSLARQIARLSYRADTGLALRHGRDRATPRHLSAAGSVAATEAPPTHVHDAPIPHGSEPVFEGATPYRIESYFAHAGETFATSTPDAWSYLATLRAMDHHDLRRLPGDAAAPRDWPPFHPIGVRSDRLVSTEDLATLVQWLQHAHVPVHPTEIESSHGHDGFLLEIPALRAALSAPLKQV